MKKDRVKYIVFIFLELLFLGIIVYTAEFSGRDFPLITVFGPFQFVLFGMAALRGGRTISYNEIAEWLRQFFTKCEPDRCGAGMSNNAKGKGVQYAFGSLIACPVCTTTWFSLLIVLWIFLPRTASLLVYVLAAAMFGEALHWTLESFEWVGRAARCLSGVLSPDPVPGHEDEEPGGHFTINLKVKG